jgi:hypothetical protein
MMVLPLGDGRLLAIIEPGNVRRMKEGQPLIVGAVVMNFVPDMEAFLKLLNLDFPPPEPGQPPVAHAVMITAEQLAHAMEEARKFPEVDR